MMMHGLYVVGECRSIEIDEFNGEYRGRRLKFLLQDSFITVRLDKSQDHVTFNIYETYYLALNVNEYNGRTSFKLREILTADSLAGVLADA